MSAAPIGTDIARAAAIIRSGGVVAYPTDTVFGLGCSIYSARAVARVLAIKRRPTHRGLPVLIASIDDAADLAEITPAFLRLAERFWPGSLTIVAPARPDQPSDLVSAGGTIGLRVPDFALTRRLIASADSPIVGTSANRSGERPALDAQTAQSTFGDEIDYILDGDATGGTASTVVSVVVHPPRLLRSGALDRETLRRVIPDLQDEECPPGG